MVTRKHWFVVAALRGAVVVRTERDAVGASRRRLQLVALSLPLALLHLGCDEKRPPKPPPPLPPRVIEVDARPAPKGLGPFDNIKDAFRRDCPPHWPRHDGLVETKNPTTGQREEKFGDGITANRTGVHCAWTTSGARQWFHVSHDADHSSPAHYDSVLEPIRKVERGVESQLLGVGRNEMCDVVFKDAARYASALLALPPALEAKVERLLAARAATPSPPARVVIDSRPLCVEAGHAGDSCWVAVSDCTNLNEAKIPLVDIALP